MNNNLLNIIKEIIEKNGESILSDPRKVKSFLADLAREEPKPQKNALIKCLEYGLVQTLKNDPAQNRELCKQRLAKKLHNEEGFDLGLCEDTLDLLAAALFGEEQEQKKNLCKNCGKELQEGWQACPFCGAAVGNQAAAPVIQSVLKKADSGGAQTNSTGAAKFAQWRQVCTFEGRIVAFSPNGKYIVSVSERVTLKLWDIKNRGLIRTFEEHKGRVTSVAFSPDSKYIVSGAFDGALTLWETESGNLIRKFFHAPFYLRFEFFLSSVAFSPDGKYIVSGAEDKNVKLWEVKSGRLIRTLKEHKEGVTSVAFSPDGKYIASGAGDKNVKLWETENGRPIRSFEGPVRSVAFSPNGKYIVSAGADDKTVKLWETENGRLIRIFEGHNDYVFSVAFSPDGSYIVSGSEDKTVKLWEAGSGQLIRTFEGHKELIRSVAFSPDGNYIASGSNDNSLIIWGE